MYNLQPTDIVVHSSSRSFYNTVLHPAGECPAGYYCEGGTNTQSPTDLTTHKGALCPAGNFCAGKNAAPVLCLAGFYQDNIGLLEILFKI